MLILACYCLRSDVKQSCKRHFTWKKPTYRFPNINASYLFGKLEDKYLKLWTTKHFLKLCCRSHLIQCLLIKSSAQSPKLDPREIAPMRPLESDADVSVASVVVADEHHLTEVLSLSPFSFHFCHLRLFLPGCVDATNCCSLFLWNWPSCKWIRLVITHNHDSLRVEIKQRAWKNSSCIKTFLSWMDDI